MCRKGVGLEQIKHGVGRRGVGLEQMKHGVGRKGVGLEQMKHGVVRKGVVFKEHNVNQPRDIFQLRFISPQSVNVNEGNFTRTGDRYTGLKEYHTPIIQNASFLTFNLNHSFCSLLKVFHLKKCTADMHNDLGIVLTVD